jgi:hypothetical protein
MYAPSETKTSCTLFSCTDWHLKLFGFLIFSLGAYMMFLFHLERTWCFCFTWSVHDVFVSLEACMMDSQKIWYGHVDEEDHLRFNNRNFNGNFNNKYIYNKSCRCRNTDHWTTLGTNSQSVEVSIVIKTHDVFVSLEAYMMFLFHLKRTWCFCFTWSGHDVFVSLGAYMMFLFHLERTWCFCFTWSVHDVFVSNKNIMYAPSETKTSCPLQVKQKHHVRFKWKKNIMSAPSETKTSCTLQVKRLEIQTI